MATRNLTLDDSTGQRRASQFNVADILAVVSSPLAGDTLTFSTIGTTETQFASMVKIPAQYPKLGLNIFNQGFGTYSSSATLSQRARVRIGPLSTALTSRALVADSGTLNSLLAGTDNSLYRFETMVSVISITGNNVTLGCASKLDFVSQSSGQSTPFMAGPTPAIFGTVVIDKSVDNYICHTDTFGGTGTGSNTLRMLISQGFSTS